MSDTQRLTPEREAQIRHFVSGGYPGFGGNASIFLPKSELLSVFDELDALRRERKDADFKCQLAIVAANQQKERADKAERERDEARERMVRARSALENWGRHHPWCDAVRNVNLPGDCSCGYVAAVNDANPVNVANTAAMAKDGGA